MNKINKNWHIIVKVFLMVLYGIAIGMAFKNNFDDTSIILIFITNISLLLESRMPKVKDNEKQI